MLALADLLPVSGKRLQCIVHAVQWHSRALLSTVAVPIASHAASQRRWISATVVPWQQRSMPGHRAKGRQCQTMRGSGVREQGCGTKQCLGLGWPRGNVRHDIIYSRHVN